MATELDLINKRDKSYNTGVKGTDIEFSKIIGNVMVPYDYAIDLTADLLTHLTAKGRAQDKNDRIFALPKIAEAVDSSTESNKMSWGYGSESTVGDGNYIITFFPHNPGKAVMKVLRKFNKEQNKYRVLLIDDQYRILCTKDPGSTNPRGFTLMDIFSDKWPINTGEGTKLGMRLAFLDPLEMTDNLHVIDTGFDVLSAIDTINDVTISVAAALSSGNVKIFATTNDGHDNFFDSFGTEMADTDGFAPTVQANGTGITVSAASLTIVGGKTAMSVTMTTNLPSSGGKVIFKFADLATLLGLGVDGYESNELILTV